jgi:hypothetical protein
MNFGDRKSFLELKSIWKDEHMFELKVTASNVRFFGETDVYDQFECLSEFAAELTNYPIGNKTLFYEAGEKDCTGYFSMKYYPIEQNGHIGVQIELESKVTTVYRPEEKNKLKIEIIVEPNAIDNFQKQLLSLVRNEEGSAILYGSDNIPDD